MKQKRLPKSIRKYIRKKKSLIRKKYHFKKEQDIEIDKLYQGVAQW